MFLNLFDKEKKLLFLELDLHVAKVDKVLHEREKIIIDTHCNEMHIDNNNYENEMSLEETLNQIEKMYTTKEKRMAFLEIVALIIADDEYANEEIKFVDKLCENFSIDYSERETAFEALRELKSSYIKISDFIMR